LVHEKSHKGTKDTKITKLLYLEFSYYFLDYRISRDFLGRKGFLYENIFFKLSCLSYFERLLGKKMSLRTKTLWSLWSLCLC